jgi:cytoskeletal protein RodZ
MDIRKLMKEQQTSRQSKLLSKYAKRMDGDKILCIPCNMIITHTLLWDDHEANKEHQQNMQIYLRESEESSKKPKIDKDVKESAESEQFAVTDFRIQQAEGTPRLDIEFANFMAEMEALPSITTNVISTETDEQVGTSISEDEYTEKADEGRLEFLKNAAKHYMQKHQRSKSRENGDKTEDLEEDFDWRHRSIK